MTRIQDLSKRGRKTAAGRPLSSEELDARVAETAKLFAAATPLDEPEAGAASEPGERRDAIEASTAEAMRGYVKDELTIVSKLEGPDGIDPAEREREIARRALSKLTKRELQDAATSVSLPRTGNKDDLVTRLLQRLGGHVRAVSSLLSSVDRQTREGRRHASRLFAFEDLGDPGLLAASLSAYEGRYVRTDVASWFLLTKADASTGPLALEGVFRVYDVALDSEDLRESERNLRVELRVESDDSILRAHSRTEAESISAVEAFAFLVGQLPLVPLAKVARSRPTWGSAGALNLSTTWFIGLLLGLLDHVGIELLDVTSASFDKPKGDRSEVLDASVPHVGSAQLRGQHVLDSQQAARHLANGERLRAVSAMVRFTKPDQTQVTLPVRLGVEPSYIAVMTGFGGIDMAESRTMHRGLEEYVASAMRRPAYDESRLTEVVDEMLRRATDPSPPQVANMFARVRDAEIRLERA